MNNHKQFIVSHAPFWHNGSSIVERNHNILLAALPALLFGIIQYGVNAFAVACLAISTAMLWELVMNKLTKRPVTIADGHAALSGLLFAMVLPATAPWWLVLIGTFVAIVIGKQIFGGIGSNPFNPIALSVAILMVSWPDYFDFNAALVHYDFSFLAAYPLTALKYFGPEAVDGFNIAGLLLGQQVGAIGATFGLGLIIGGLYLIVRGFIRWEIVVSFVGGVFVAAMLFNISDPSRFGSPAMHLLTGYTLIGAIFLATDDSSSPVNFIPMLLYGATAGIMTVLIRNIGVYVDGVIFAILIANLLNPLLDKIRPQAIGKVV
jgi:electron transport complex protein RnfD